MFRICVARITHGMCSHMLHGFGNDAIVYGHMYQLGEESIEKHEKIAQQKKHNNTNIAKEENKH